MQMLNREMGDEYQPITAWRELGSQSDPTQLLAAVKGVELIDILIEILMAC